MSKSPLNKTIDTTVEEGSAYLARCVRLDTACVIPPDSTVCADMLDACGHIPEKSVDLIIADPPYNLYKTYSGRAFNRMDRDEYEKYTRRWIEAVEPLLKDDGSVYICCDWESSLIIGSVLPDYFLVRNRITWQREKGRGARANWKNGMEDIWFATKGRDYTFNLDAVKTRRRVIAPYREEGRPKDWEETASGNFRDTCPSNFWDDLTVPFWSMPENTAHPTQKPEKLMARLILASSNPGDLVLDPFVGSGTTSVTASKLDRRYIGIEREERFCIWTEQRLEMARTDRRIQGFEDGVFWERNSSAAVDKKRKK